MTAEEYWAAIERIPLYRERESTDGQAYLCRDANGQPVRVTKPEYLQRDGEREAAIALHRLLHAPVRH